MPYIINHDDNVSCIFKLKAVATMQHDDFAAMFTISKSTVHMPPQMLEKMKSNQCCSSHVRQRTYRAVMKVQNTRKCKNILYAFWKMFANYAVLHYAAYTCNIANIAHIGICVAPFCSSAFMLQFTKFAAFWGREMQNRKILAKSSSVCYYAHIWRTCKSHAM